MSRELESRFQKFAKDVRNLCSQLHKDVINLEYIKQIARSSASIGANYIEASDPLGKADEKLKIRIARREAKETHHFLGLLITGTEQNEKEREVLLDECEQIKKILSAILLKLN